MQGFPIRLHPRDVPLIYEHVYHGILRHILWAVTEIADKAYSPTKDVTKVEAIYRGHKQAWESPYQKRTFIAPLVGFKSDLDVVSVGRGYIIKRLTDQEKNLLCND